MKKNLKKIVINLCALISFSACHTIDHKNQFILPIEMNKQKINNKPEKKIEDAIIEIREKYKEKKITKKRF